MNSEFISGTVAILGRPNVGKSTFLNTVLGQKVAIVSPRPQTTRSSMAGIFQDEQAQIAFYDTPGVHQGKNKLSHYMVAQAEEALNGSDAVLFLLDVRDGITDEDQLLADWLKPCQKPVLLLLNKIDQAGSARIGEVAQKARELVGSWPQFRIAAVSGRGIPEVLKELKDLLPHQPPLFPGEDLTDKTMREIASELIREQCFLQLKQEIPYGVAVSIEKYEERQPPEPILIQATIFAEKESQKGILIGTKGQQLKSIGTAARKEIEKLTGQKVFLELWVKILKDWRKDDKWLNELGYRQTRKGKA